MLKEDGTPMTLEEQVMLFTDATCPSCYGNYGWKSRLRRKRGGAVAFVVQCKGCHTKYPEGQ